MFIDWLNLGRAPYPGRKGIPKIKVWLKYLFFAVRGLGKRQKLATLLGGQIESQIWSTLSKWLIFQMKYFNPADYARSPVILDVAGGYATNVSIKGPVIRDTVLQALVGISNRLSNVFRGYSAMSYENWLKRIYSLLDYFQTPLTSNDQSLKISYVEIGPGLGGLMAIISETTKCKIYSYDIVEMQLIQSYVVEQVFLDTAKVNFIQTNLKSQSHINLPIPAEPYILVAFWSFSEIGFNSRTSFIPLINKSLSSLIICNKLFEGIHNFEYLEQLAIKLGKKFEFAELGEILGDGLPGYSKSHRLYYIY